MNLKVKYLRDVQPISYSREGDCAIDLRASGAWIVDLDGTRREILQDEYFLYPNERIIVESGIAIELSKGFFGSTRDRSGMAGNHGLHVLGGVLDENFRGEIGIIIINLSSKPQLIKKNERVAQLIIQPYERVDIIKVDELSETNRGIGRLGSSGRM